MKPNETDPPFDVRLLVTLAVVPMAYAFPYPVKEARSGAFRAKPVIAA
jgi:hypothetical protein